MDTWDKVITKTMKASLKELSDPKFGGNYYTNKSTSLTSQSDYFQAALQLRCMVEQAKAARSNVRLTWAITAATIVMALTAFWEAIRNCCK